MIEYVVVIMIARSQKEWTSTLENRTSVKRVCGKCAWMHLH